MFKKSEIKIILFGEENAVNEEPFRPPSDEEIEKLIELLNPRCRKRARDALKITMLWNWHKGLEKSSLSDDDKKHVKAFKTKSKALIAEISKQREAEALYAIYGKEPFVFGVEVQEAESSLNRLIGICEDMTAKRSKLSNIHEFIFHGALLFEHITQEKFTSSNDREGNRLESKGEKFIEALTEIVTEIEYAENYDLAIFGSAEFGEEFIEPEKRKILSTEIKTACQYARKRIDAARAQK